MTDFAEPEALIDDILSHHGIKGMHWGVRRTAEEIKTARERHNNRMSKLDTEATRLSLAKSTAQKKKILNDIHNLAKEAQKSGDVDVAAMKTRGEKFAASFFGGPIGAHISNKRMEAQREAANQLLETYKNAKLSDFYHA